MSIRDKATQTESELHASLDEMIAASTKSRDANAAGIDALAQELAVFRATFQQEMNLKMPRRKATTRTRRCEACNSKMEVDTSLPPSEIWCEGCGYCPASNSFIY
jgi:hypothetical protein